MRAILSRTVLAAALLLLPLVASGAVGPLPGHPGNIFLTDEEISVPLSGGQGGAWRLVDYDGKVVREGQGEGGKARIGRLGAGYYELRVGQGPRVTVGVIERLRADTPADSPICIDVAMSWFYGAEQKAAVANLCAMAGANWVRDRLAWGEAEPRRGEFAANTRYDSSAEIQSAARLRVLQVNHSSPGWANPNGKRFPLDLRDAYKSYRQFAQRWKGKVLAFEPWNEADIDVFGGQTGSEMASLQKASYLGLKAGNPDIIACLNVFATNRRASLDDLAANEAWPYFDTCNLHHYIAADQYPAWYAAFRGICAGRPMWVTEFSMPVQFSGDAQVQEPSDEDLRKQAERVTVGLASSVYEGPAESFYFMFPHYVEGKTQFGIVHKDLTPRPAYVAYAAVGRLLAGAKPIGKLKGENAALRAFVFNARPDGREQEVMVAWTTGASVALPAAVKPKAIYDHLGRLQALPGGAVQVRRQPMYVLMAPGSAGALGLEAAAKRPEWREGKASPIVLQAIFPVDQILLSPSAYRVPSAKPQSVRVFIYNFSEQAATGSLKVSGPASWKLSVPEKIEIAPGDRREIALLIECEAPANAPVGTVKITGDFGPAGKPVLSLRIQPEPMKTPPAAAAPIGRGDEPGAWDMEISGGSHVETAAEPAGGMRISADLGPGDRWIYPRIDLKQNERAARGTRELHFRLSALEGNAHFRVIFVEESGAAYVGELLTLPANGQTIEAVAQFEDAIHGGWSPADPNGRLDPELIKSIKIGCNTSSARVSYSFGNLRWVKW